MYGADWTRDKVIECLTDALRRPLRLPPDAFPDDVDLEVNERNVVAAAAAALQSSRFSGGPAQHLIQHCLALRNGLKIRSWLRTKGRGWGHSNHYDMVRRGASRVAEWLNARSSGRLVPLVANQEGVADRTYAGTRLPRAS